ncbi:hypothetical protein ACRAKJ_28730 [Saccharothrix sp. DSM 118769]
MGPRYSRRFTVAVVCTALSGLLVGVGVAYGGAVVVLPAVLCTLVFTVLAALWQHDAPHRGRTR